MCSCLVSGGGQRPSASLRVNQDPRQPWGKAHSCHPLSLLCYMTKSNTTLCVGRVCWWGENHEAQGCTIFPGLSTVLQAYRMQDTQLSPFLMKDCKQKTARGALPAPGPFGKTFPRHSSEMAKYKQAGGKPLCFFTAVTICPAKGRECAVPLLLAGSACPGVHRELGRPEWLPGLPLAIALH